jgi:hypothetical protein
MMMLSTVIRTDPKTRAAARDVVARPALATLAILAALLFHSAPARAVTRTCGSDAAANTTNVLCASPSGPCDGSSVAFSTNTEVEAGGCTFDLGGRDLTVSKTLDMIGSGFIKVVNAGAITITDTGKLRARGDFAVSGIHQGGTIELTSASTITHQGLIDVYGDAAGVINLEAAGDVTLASGSALRGLGDSAGSGDAARFADGGRCEIASTGGSIVVDGEVAMVGETNAQGGDVSLRAARDIDIVHVIEVTGGASGGGSISAIAGDDITVTATLDAESGGGGGPGGDIDLVAGEDSLGGIDPGGALGMDGGLVKLNGSGASANDDDGGTFSATSDGPLLLGPDTTINANAANAAAGDGGAIDLDAGSGSLEVESPINASGGGEGGGGGRVALAGAEVTLASTADVSLTGRERGGALDVDAGAQYVQSNEFLLNGTVSGATGGNATIAACDLTASESARLEANATNGGLVKLVGRDHMTIDPSSHVQATGTGGVIRLVARSLGACTNDAGRECVVNADCTVGCNTGQCQGVRFDTGGTSAQFNPTPAYSKDASLPTCP